MRLRGKKLVIAIAAVAVSTAAAVIVLRNIKKNRNMATGRISDKGISLIKRFEGVRLKAYKDVAGVPTIGYGHTSGVKMGDTISQERADELLKQDLKSRESTVASYVDVRTLTQNQFDALVSFVYNLGSGNFKSSTLLKKVRANPDDKTIRGEFMKFNKARIGGVLKAVDGLTNRRKAEADFYFG